MHGNSLEAYNNMVEILDLFKKHLFYGKDPERLWEEHALERIAYKVKAYGPRQERVFQDWLARFGS